MLSRHPSRRLLGLLGLVVAGIAFALHWRRNPSPCPYSQRRWIDLPRPVITRSRVRDLLGPRPGERVLEVGPGTGYYTLPVARSLEPDGTLHAADVQPAMVEHLQTRLQEANRRNVEPVGGDAQALPYADDSFEAAYLVLVLGEIPDQERALAELRRVLKPGGRLVVGELLPDPHFVRAGQLRRRAERQGFRFEERDGTPIGYVARLSVPA
ncbi:class I SAM-dependent methyltransferase [Halosolutus amylolyticus]|uniref:Class I SAM-dependent methyltransferase n=2 Tax=Halosolutus amylolyticus TaxID=2932267 RepID=A0ABD5PLA6_9EURY